METNPDLEKIKTYLFSYFYNATWWGIEINALNQEDAKEILNRLPSAQYDGELQKKIYVACEN